MKIAVVHNLRRGGAARRMRGTVQAWTTMPGIELREFCLTDGIASIGGSDADGRALPSPRRVQVNCVASAGKLPRSIRPLVRYADHAMVLAAWRRLAGKINQWEPDGVFANPCSVLNGAPPTLGKLHAPTLYYCDEPRRADYDERAADSTNPATRRLYRPLRSWQKHADRAGVAGASALATNSSFSAIGIGRAYGRDASVITPGIANIFRPRPSEPDELPDRVVSVGSMIPSKGHDLAIAAVAASGVGLPLTVVSPRNSIAERARLQGLARAAGVELDIRIGIPDEELVELYRSSLATLYLALQEPLGLVSLESQACGTPVIVSDEGGLVETVDHEVTGFRVRRTTADAAEALRALADPARRASMSRAAAHQRVPRDEDGAIEILGIFEELFGHQPRDERRSA
ncbi:MAG: group 1 glycosyl transferase [Frankiales bacterium]|nr:group 1 glycosyl transferase [Frankiales bacterium]